MNETTNQKLLAGISIRTLNIIMFAIAVILAALLLLATNQVSDSYEIMQDATEEYIECQSAAQNMMSASDYLTEQVRSFTVTGDTDYVKNFFEEVNQTKRRDNALATLEQYLQGTDTYRYLQEESQRTGKDGILRDTPRRRRLRTAAQPVPGRDPGCRTAAGTQGHDR